MEKEIKNKIIAIKESLIKSIIADFFTFCFMVASSWFNYQFIGGSKFVYTIILIMFMIFLVVNGKNRVNEFYNKKDAINYLNK